jgi:hypothetical protein
MIRTAIAVAAMLALTPAAWAQGKPKLVGNVYADQDERDYSKGKNDKSLMRAAAMTADGGSFGELGYPAAALRARSTGVVGIRVTIGADDRLLGCEVIRAAADARLTAAACLQIRKYGKFIHALGTDGVARGAAMLLDLHFELVEPIDPDAPPVVVNVPEAQVAAPGSPKIERPKPVDPAALVIFGATAADFPNELPAVKIDVDASGAVTRCSMFIASGTDKGDIAMCRQISRARFRPQTVDGRAEAVEGHIEFIELRR